MAMPNKDSVAYAEAQERSAPARRQRSRHPKEKKQEQQEKSPLKVVRDKSGFRKRRRRRMFMLGSIVAVVAVYILICQMQLTQLTAQVNEQTSKLDELTAENISLTTKKEYSMNMTEIEDYAVNKLGMVKMDTSQIEYIELVNPDNITVQNQGVSMDSVFASIAKSFSAVVEYLS